MRLEKGGSRIDRSRTVHFTFDGRQYEGFAGDTIASALLANNVRIVGHGIYTGRPRGVFTAGAEEPNAIVQVRWPHGTSEPSLRATVVEIADGMEARSLRGRGRLDGPGKVRVVQQGEDGTSGAGGDRTLNANDVIIATGSRVKSLPGLEPDGKRIVTSDDVLRMDTLPKDIVIVGAGAVGVEFASMFHDVGVKVTLLEYLPNIVPLEDPEVSRVVERSFQKRGMTVMTNARFDPKSVTTDENGICLEVGPEGKDSAELRAEMMLVATGRAANIENIGLETTKVETDRGVIKVDGHMRTREPHVYAIGDIVGGLWLAHTAGHEGITAAHVIAGEADVHEMDYNAQPRATYCRPEVASVGLTEPQAKEKGFDIKVGKVPFQAIAKALIGGEYEGFAKIIGDRKTDDTLGVHVVGPHATDLIAEASLAFQLDATPWEIGAATHPHPTLAEVVGEAAMAVDGRSINF